MSAYPLAVDLGSVLVVGGSGLVGRHCVKDLVRSGAAKVHALSSRKPTKDRETPGVEYHIADLRDAAGVRAIVQLARPDVVIHAASPQHLIGDPGTYDLVNVRGTRDLLAACDAVGATKAFIYCSTGAVIHDGSKNIQNADETCPPLEDQKDPYSRSKAIAEKLVLEHNQTNGRRMLTTVLRLTSIFGVGDEAIIGSIMEQARSGQLKYQIGDGKNRNDWTYVENVAAALTHTARRLLADPPISPHNRVDGEIFFITNDDPRPFWDFGRQVAREAGYPIEPEQITRLPASMAYVIGLVSEYGVLLTSFGRRRSKVSRRSMSYCIIDQTFCVDKARTQLGFVPSISVDEGIRRSVEPFLVGRDVVRSGTKAS